MEETPKGPLEIEYGESRMLAPAEEARKSRISLSDPAEIAKCLPLYLTHCEVMDKNRIALRGVINNPIVSDSATNVAVVVSNVHSYFFLQFKSNEMNPLIYPHRIDSYLYWLERQFLSFPNFHIPEGGNIEKTQMQYNSLHVSNKKVKKSWGKNAVPVINAPEDLNLFRNWQDVSNH